MTTIAPHDEVSLADFDLSDPEFWLAPRSFREGAFKALRDTPGLVHFAVVRDNRANAATATGVIQTGLSLGAAAGPLLFGLLTAATSYDTAWLAAAVVAALAAVTFTVARRMIRRSRALTAAEIPAATPSTTDHTLTPLEEKR